MGEASLIKYGSDVLVNITIMSLIIIGGLGFTVWSDIFKTLKKSIKEKIYLLEESIEEYEKWSKDKWIN